MLKQNTATNRTLFLGNGLTTVSLNSLSKNGGTFAAPSLGTVTSLGNGWYAVALNATDTNTVGDLAYHFTAAIGIPTDPPADQVLTAPMAMVPNNGTADIAIRTLQIIVSGGTACTISGDVGLIVQGTTSVGAAIYSNPGNNVAGLIITGDVGVEIDAYAGPMLRAGTTSGPACTITTSDAAAPAVQLVGGTAGLDIQGTADHGLTVSGITGGVAITGGIGTNGAALYLSGDVGMDIESANGPALNVQSTSGPGIQIFTNGAGTDGILISAINNGMTINGTGGKGIEVVGATDGLSLTSGAGFALSYNTVNLPVAIATGLLDLINGVETNKTVRQTLRLILAAACGKSSLIGTTRVYRDTNDAVDRITAITDQLGQRTSVIYIA